MRAMPVDQRGLAALAFVLVLLFTMSLALLWTGRSLVFEQRAAANQQRQAIAFATAESGLGWAIARLNDGRAIDGRCLPSSATLPGPSFRDRYAAPWMAAPVMGALDRPVADEPHATGSGYAPPPGLRASCRVGANEILCHCDALPASSATSSDGSPSFTIEFTPVVGEARALWIIARGCSGAWADCLSTRTAQTEAQAVLRVKLRPAGDARNGSEAEVLRSGPMAVVPGSWRDGHCTSVTPTAPCNFES
jgi:PilX N-terminal